MRIITFTTKVNPINDFDVENVYEEMKFKDNILISNQTLLYRSRVGVKQVEDLDGEIYEDMVTKNGIFNNNVYLLKYYL